MQRTEQMMSDRSCAGMALPPVTADRRISPLEPPLSGPVTALHMLNRLASSALCLNARSQA